jgi:DNA-binding MurR/RpiR family transcriptional regulator
MFGWFGKDKKPANPPAKAGGKESSASTKDELIRQAMQNARTARQSIGEENLARLAELMQQQRKKQELERAKEILRQMDPEKLVDNFRYLIDEDKGRKD